MTKKRNNLIKKITSLMLIISLLFAFSSFTVSANDEIKVLLDGKPITFDVPPQIINGRTMVPLRAIFEAMNASVKWNDATKAVTAYRGDTTVKMSIDSNQLDINGKLQSMDSMPVIIDDRTLAPARYVAESFGYDVEWKATDRCVNIFSDSANCSNDIFFNAISKHKVLEHDGAIYSLNSVNKLFFNEDDPEGYPDTSLSYDCESKEIIVWLKDTNHVDGADITITVTIPDKSPQGKTQISLKYNDWEIIGQGEFDKNSIAFNFSKDVTVNLSYNNSEYAPKVEELKKTCDELAGTATIVALNAIEEFFKISNESANVVQLGFKTLNTGICASAYWDDVIRDIKNIIKYNKNSLASSSNNSSYDVYDGTILPTYTSVTGVKLKRLITSEGFPVYVYAYTNASDVNLYLHQLSSLGWKILHEDDPYTYDVYEGAFYKGNGIALVNVYFRTNEVWITY